MSFLRWLFGYGPNKLTNLDGMAGVLYHRNDNETYVVDTERGTGDPAYIIFRDSIHLQSDPERKLPEDFKIKIALEVLDQFQGKRKTFKVEIAPPIYPSW